MEDNYEKYAVAVIIVFGALLIGGLMAAGLSMAAIVRPFYGAGFGCFRGLGLRRMPFCLTALGSTAA